MLFLLSMGGPKVCEGWPCHVCTGGVQFPSYFACPLIRLLCFYCNHLLCCITAYCSVLYDRLMYCSRLLCLNCNTSACSRHDSSLAHGSHGLDDLTAPLLLALDDAGSAGQCMATWGHGRIGAWRHGSLHISKVQPN